MGAQNTNLEEDVITVTLTLDNDEVVECAVCHQPSGKISVQLPGINVERQIQ